MPCIWTTKNVRPTARLKHAVVFVDLSVVVWYLHNEIELGNGE
jgi:hypothetical protein